MLESCAVCVQHHVCQHHGQHLETSATSMCEARYNRASSSTMLISLSLRLNSNKLNSSTDPGSIPSGSYFPIVRLLA
eukprot:3291854-Amphidinium_carterae.1